MTTDSRPQADQKPDDEKPPAAVSGRESTADSGLVAELARRALTQPSLKATLEDAVTMLRDTLRTDAAYILELVSTGEGFLLTSAAGWHPEYVGQVVVPLLPGSQAAYVVEQEAPVLIEDLSAETRFQPMPFLLEHGIRSVITIAIRDKGRLLGMISAQGAEPRTFTQDDARFVSAVAAVIGAAFDRRDTETALLESEERLRLAMEAGRMGAWEWRVPTQEVIWSESLQKIHGLEPGQFEGTFEAFQRDMHPDDRERVARTIQQSLENGRHEIEYRIIRPDGSIRWLAARGLLIRDDRGQPNRMIGICTDITDSKIAAQEHESMFAELQSAEARYRNLFTGVGDTIVLTNSRAEVVDVNPAATDLLGYSREELATMHVSDVIVQGFTWSAETVMQFIQGGEWKGELALRRKDGSLVDVEAKATAILLPIGPIFVAVLRDVTERKRTEDRLRELVEQSQQIQEELRLANESKDEFLGLVSHELRTPITTIFGGARLLRTRGDRLDEQSKAEVLEDIERESERLHRIVEDLLVLARIELGQEIVTEPVLARRVVERAVSTFSKRRPGRPIEIQTDSKVSPVRASSVYIDQVLRNLINNADKYSPPGQPIDIWVRREGDELVVSVMDRGPGISSEEMDLIFERFYRSGATSSQASGAGIGLTVCKRLIEVQNGRIWAGAREGGGLIISFALPTEEE